METFLFFGVLILIVITLVTKLGQKILITLLGYLGIIILFLCMLVAIPFDIILIIITFGKMKMEITKNCQKVISSIFDGMKDTWNN